MGVSFRSCPEVAAIFEDNGLESMWIPEHLVFPAEMPPTYPYTDSGYPPVTPDTPIYDPWVVLSTSRAPPVGSGWRPTSSSFRCAIPCRRRAPWSASIGCREVG